MIMTNFKIQFIVLLVLVVSCTQKEKKIEKEIVVTIDDKTITANEFKQRAEFTIRPEIFAGKQVVLNNLIAEKLLAYEAEKNAEITKQEHLINLTKGIKEQTMREQLYFSEVYDRITINPEEVDRVLPLSNRSYELGFYNIGNKKLADSLANQIAEHPDSAPQIFDRIAAFDSLPKHTLRWQDSDSYIIHDALFSQPLSENQVVGPLHLEDNSFLIVKVIGWVDNPVIGPEEIARRRQEVEKKLKEKKAEKEWLNYMQQTMAGKEINFDPDIFNKLVELSYSVYSQGVLEDKLPLEDQSGMKEPAQFALNEMVNNPAYKDLPFFTIDDTEWSIKKFKDELSSHPLVFRQNKIGTFQEYKEQFRAAIADLVRDYFLTQIAYENAFEKSPQVIRVVSMWRDASLAQAQWYRYANFLRNRPDFDPENMKGLNNYLGQYIDSLLTAYQSRITVNQTVLKNIRLTHMPMYVYKPGMPYSDAVPVFPQLTLRKNVNY
jgi:hypothetical protein